MMVAVGFNPRTGCRAYSIRRVATPDRFQSSLRDERLTEHTSDRGLKPTATIVLSLRDTWMNETPGTKPSAFFSPTSFRDLVSGRQRGALAAMLRAALAAAEVPYTWAVRWRNRRYDQRKAAVSRVGVPVISVGNLTLGGTGKTPMVEWIVRRYLARGKKVGILSRGYASHSGPNDEARELEWKLPGVPHVQDPDRVAAAHRAIGEFGCEVLVLDDAFQHRRIGRDLDIVLLDALEPLGYERVFPRGTLREPVTGLVRADVIALSRADLLTADERGAFHDRVRKLSPRAVWVEVVHAPWPW